VGAASVAIGAAKDAPRAGTNLRAGGGGVDGDEPGFEFIEVEDVVRGGGAEMAEAGISGKSEPAFSTSSGTNGSVFESSEVGGQDARVHMAVATKYYTLVSNRLLIQRTLISAYHMTS
jgi:hypothetical protein